MDLVRGAAAGAASLLSHGLDVLTHLGEKAWEDEGDVCGVTEPSPDGRIQLLVSNTGKFRYRLLASDGVVVLRAAKDYETKNAVEDEIARIRVHGANESCFEKAASENGKHYFHLKSPIEHEIIGTSKMFDNIEECDKVIKTVIRHAKAAKLDDLVRSGRRGTYELMKSPKNGTFSFSLKASNGEIILQSSHDYATKREANDGIKLVREMSTNDKQFDKATSENGKFFFRLKAPNDSDILGLSQMYQASPMRDNGIDSVMRHAAHAKIEDAEVDRGPSKKRELPAESSTDLPAKRNRTSPPPEAPL